MKNSFFHNAFAPPECFLSRRIRNIKTISISRCDPLPSRLAETSLHHCRSRNFTGSVLSDSRTLPPVGICHNSAPSPEDRSFFFFYKRVLKLYYSNIQHFLFYSRDFQREIPSSAGIKSSQRALSASRKSSFRISFRGIQRNSCPSFATASLPFFRRQRRKTSRIAPAG